MSYRQILSLPVAEESLKKFQEHRQEMDYIFVCMFYVDKPFLAGCNAIVCDKCFRRNFSELAYQYRRDIPLIELPGSLFVCLRENET